VGVRVLIQITPQLRILVAIEAIDGRKYAPSIDMRSLLKTEHARLIGKLSSRRARRRIT
jgi:hypothetical protein